MLFKNWNNFLCRPSKQKGPNKHLLERGFKLTRFMTSKLHRKRQIEIFAVCRFRYMGAILLVPSVSSALRVRFTMFRSVFFSWASQFFRPEYVAVFKSMQFHRLKQQWSRIVLKTLHFWQRFNRFWCGYKSRPSKHSLT